MLEKHIFWPAKDTRKWQEQKARLHMEDYLMAEKRNNRQTYFVAWLIPSLGHGVFG